MARQFGDYVPQADLEEMSDEGLGMERNPRSRSWPSRTVVGLVLLGTTLVAALMAVALPRHEEIRKGNGNVIGLSEDSIWASVLSSDAMKQYNQEKELSSNVDTEEQAPPSPPPSSPAPAPAYHAPAPAPHYAPPPATVEKPSPSPAPITKPDVVKEQAAKAAQQLMANLFHQPKDQAKPSSVDSAVDSATSQVKDALHLSPAPAGAPAPAPFQLPKIELPKMPKIELPKMPKIELPQMPTPGPDGALKMPDVAPLLQSAQTGLQSAVDSAHAGVQGTVNGLTAGVQGAMDGASADAEKRSKEMSDMASNFLKEAQSLGTNSQQGKQLESIANMLKKDASKIQDQAKQAVNSVVPPVAPVAPLAPAVPAVPAAPAAPVATKTVTEDPRDSPLAPKAAKDGDPCVDDEEEYGGLCYKTCAALTGGSHPCRSSAWSCCAVPAGPGCAAKASFGNCWMHIGFCFGYAVGGDTEAAQSGNKCPTSEGGCLTDEELFDNMCYKKCAMLAPNFPFRVGPSSCCSKHGGLDCFWPSNLMTKPEFDVGGGQGDHNSGTPAEAHQPMAKLAE
ncbi:unnamed protein product [Effrenium voratum]|uniref:Uncharacterized protein n=1 Tax=Effrenium voratum TaxID=2562239 RepID=A0AA36HNI1_9DINO|nr:unnamed protein product [Effrenium voratum]